MRKDLRDALRAAGHEAEILAIPFKWYPPEKILDHILACRLLDVSEVAGTPVDLLIGLKFPAYLIPHPNKVLWILHQHRTAYELWDHPLSDMVYYPNGAQVRDAIEQADRHLIPEANAVFANSRNVAQRLKKFCDIDSDTALSSASECGQVLLRGRRRLSLLSQPVVYSETAGAGARSSRSNSQSGARRFAGTSDHPYLRRQAKIAGAQIQSPETGRVAGQHHRRRNANALRKSHWRRLSAD